MVHVLFIALLGIRAQKNVAHLQKLENKQKSCGDSTQAQVVCVI